MQELASGLWILARCRRGCCRYYNYACNSHMTCCRYYTHKIEAARQDIEAGKQEAQRRHMYDSACAATYTTVPATAI
jgi:hypothetical protein